MSKRKEMASSNLRSLTNSSYLFFINFFFELESEIEKRRIENKCRVCNKIYRGGKGWRQSMAEPDLKMCPVCEPIVPKEWKLIKIEKKPSRKIQSKCKDMMRVIVKNKKK